MLVPSSGVKKTMHELSVGSFCSSTYVAPKIVGQQSNVVNFS